MNGVGLMRFYCTNLNAYLTEIIYLLRYIPSLALLVDTAQLTGKSGEK